MIARSAKAERHRVSELHPSTTDNADTSATTYVSLPNPNGNVQTAASGNTAYYPGTEQTAA